MITFRRLIASLVLSASLPIACVFAKEPAADRSSDSVAADDANVLTAAQIADGWISLFDGETLFGWSSTAVDPENDAVDWQVRDGAIHATDGPVGFLVTNSVFADYELHVEFRAADNTNGGVFLHTAARPGNPQRECYEVNVAPSDNPYPTPGLVHRQKSPLRPAPADHWNSLDIRVVGESVEVSLNNEMCYRYVDPSPLNRGHIALQHNRGAIAYRNVWLKPLSRKRLFNGRNLDGWNTDRAEASRFEVTDDGELRVLDGRGQLESNDEYGDFVLQLECRVDGDALNSGVFFRCIPGDFMNGYECQIHNGFKDIDPTKPVDCGTGGIFRRQNARRIIARDHQWFAMTLVASGPHMAAWVDGVQVSDWTDEREPHENPRQGLRLAPGTLAIQGHDPTTDLRFRKLMITPLPERNDASQR